MINEVNLRKKMKPDTCTRVDGVKTAVVHGKKENMRTQGGLTGGRAIVTTNCQKSAEVIVAME